MRIQHEALAAIVVDHEQLRARKRFRMLVERACQGFRGRFDIPLAPERAADDADLRDFPLGHAADVHRPQLEDLAVRVQHQIRVAVAGTDVDVAEEVDGGDTGRLDNRRHLQYRLGRTDLHEIQQKLGPPLEHRFQRDVPDVHEILEMPERKQVEVGMEIQMHRRISDDRLVFDRISRRCTIKHRRDIAHGDVRNHQFLKNEFIHGLIYD
ncbi:hypothetical protein L3V59_03745 [Burkholderia aenigmatica]|uniref:hypothetical protein n=1 Tax=Burkholderia aenigmatica TaxID=2015348 RepID=UPI001F3A59BD|nr:hypothetical protein [Burkholderia aenigmatica]UKD13285.1 hypothetical protein L3V59_03745 [Burkholderia aenigmatica]